MNSVGNLYSDLLQLGLPLDYYKNYVSRVELLTAKELEAEARALLQPENMIWIVVGDRASLERPLAELELAPITAAVA